MLGFYLSRHGKKRLKQRVGIKKAKAYSHLLKVLYQNEILLLMKKKEIFIFYHGYKYIFKPDVHLNIWFITVMRVNKVQLIVEKVVKLEI